MSPIFRHWTLRFVSKILGWTLVLNLAVLLILWFLKVLSLFVLILVYEALLILIIGVLQILSSYIYRKDSFPSQYAGRTGWFDFKKSAELEPEERQKYRREGIIMIVIGLLLLFGTIIAHFCILA